MVKNRFLAPKLLRKDVVMNIDKKRIYKNLDIINTRYTGILDILAKKFAKNRSTIIIKSPPIEHLLYFYTEKKRKA
jgi:hypothetical protein